MSKRWKYLDKEEKPIKHGASYIYDGPNVWNAEGGEAKGIIKWDWHWQAYVFTGTAVFNSGRTIEDVRKIVSFHLWDFKKKIYKTYDVRRDAPVDDNSPVNVDITHLFRKVDISDLIGKDGSG